MRLNRTDLLPVLTIVAGGVIGASLSFSLLGSRSDDVVSVTQVLYESPATIEDLRLEEAKANAMRVYAFQQIEALREVAKTAELVTDRAYVLEKAKQLARFEEVRERGSMACQFGADIYSLDWSDSDPWVDLSPGELRIWWEGNRSLICLDGVGVDMSIWDNNGFPASDVENTALLKPDAAVPLYGDGSHVSAGVIRVTLRENRRGR